MYRKKTEENGSEYIEVSFYGSTLCREVTPNKIQNFVCGSLDQLDDRIITYPYLTMYLHAEGHLYISVVNPKKAPKLSGTDIMRAVVNYAKKNNFVILSLEDQSSLEVSVQDCQYDLDLAGLTIVATGRSWYNKLGFKQNDYDSQVLVWENIRKLTLRNLTNALLKIDDKTIECKN